MPRHKRQGSDSAPWLADALHSDAADHGAALCTPMGKQSATCSARSGKESQQRGGNMTGISRETSASTSGLQPAAPGSEDNPASTSPHSTSEAVMRFRGSRVKVKATLTHLSWKALNPTGGCCTDRRTLGRKVPFDEVLSALALPKPAALCCPRDHAFAIHTFSRGRCPNTWRPEEYVLYAGSAEQVKEWVGLINAQVALMRDRPRNLLVFVNPFSGARRARAVWEREAEPVFSRARIKVTLVETAKQDHAREAVSGMKADELAAYHGVVAVGGDGLFQEVVSGLLERRARGDVAAHRIRVGHIPAGSTDAVACTLHGSRCAATAALHIALGDRLALDAGCVAAIPGSSSSSSSSGDGAGGCSTAAGGAAAVTSLSAAAAPSPAVRHFVCQAGYGFMGDVMAASERLRCMGPSRYDITGALQYLRLASYRVALSYKEAAPLPAALGGSGDGGSSGGGGGGGGSGGGGGGTGSERLLCTTRCEVCRMAGIHVGPHYHRPSGAAASLTAAAAGAAAAAPPPPPHLGTASAGLSPSPSGASPTGGVAGSRHVYGSGAATPQGVAPSSSAPASADGPPALERGGAWADGSGHAAPAGGAGGLGGYSFGGSHPWNMGGGGSNGSPRAGGAGEGHLHSGPGGGGGSGALLHAAVPLSTPPPPAPPPPPPLAVHAPPPVPHSVRSGQASPTLAAAAGVSGSLTGPLLAPPPHRADSAASVGVSGAGGGEPGGGGGRPSGTGLTAAPPLACAPLVDAEGWTHVEGEFVSVKCVVTPCRSDKSKRGIVPHGHLSDGRMYLVLVSKCSHLSFLRFLVRLSTRGLTDRCLPCVRVIPITALRLSPLPGGHTLGGCLWDAAAPESVWNVDGELLTDNHVSVSVMRGAVEVFARGPEAAAGQGGGMGGLGQMGGGGGGRRAASPPAPLLGKPR